MYLDFKTFSYWLDLANEPRKLKGICKVVKCIHNLGRIRESMADFYAKDKKRYEEIYVRPQTNKDGEVCLVDQYGRILKGVIDMNVLAPDNGSVDAILTIKCLDMNGKAIPGRYFDKKSDDN